MKKAIIDIGSNSIRFVIYHNKNGYYEKLMSQKKTLGLINYREDDVINKEGIEKLCLILQDFQKIFKNLNVNETYYFATEALRNAANREDILKNIKQQSGISIDILSRQDEGMYDFYGMKQSIQRDTGVMIDIGGGSLEVVHFENNKIIQNQSFPLGSLNLYKEHVKGVFPTTKELNLISDFIKYQMQSLDTSYHFIHAIGIGGTLRATIQIARHILRKNNIQNTITKEEITYLIKILTQKTKKTTQIILQHYPERIHTIIPGLMILNELMHRLKIQDLTISYTGVRDGYFIRKVLKK